MAKTLFENGDTVGNLVGRVAYGFGDLLTSIKGSANTALKNSDPHSPAHRNIREIEKALRRGGALVEKLLASSGQVTPNYREVNITRLMDPLVEAVDRFLGDNIVLNYNQVVGLPLVHGDPAQLRQAISNLIVNAVESIGSADGVVTVQTGVMNVVSSSAAEADELAPGSYVFIKISDTGCGMQSAVQEKMFEPFFSTKGNSRGLGLSAALGTIRTHGGSLTAKSVYGHGSTFTVLLPVMMTKRQNNRKKSAKALSVPSPKSGGNRADSKQLAMVFRDY